jgi:hypothetical protein
MIYTLSPLELSNIKSSALLLVKLCQRPAVMGHRLAAMKLGKELSADVTAF